MHTSIGATFFVLLCISVTEISACCAGHMGFCCKISKLTLKQKLNLKFPIYIKCPSWSLHSCLLLYTYSFTQWVLSFMYGGTFSRGHGESPMRAQNGKRSSFLGGGNGVFKMQLHPWGALKSHWNQATLHKRAVPFCSHKSCRIWYSGGKNSIFRVTAVALQIGKAPYWSLNKMTKGWDFRNSCIFNIC